MYVKERVPVRSSYGVQSVITSKRTPVPEPRLRNNVQRRSTPATRRTDDTEPKHVVEFGLSNLLLLRGKATEALELHGPKSDNVMHNVMGNGLSSPIWVGKTCKYGRKSSMKGDDEGDGR